jgi:acyl-CoA synthetase (AMP-forming)/AMP-acid ligase II
VVDDELGECPVGEVGEIVVRSDQVLQRYWDNPQATADALAGGWFRTGDLARRDPEGYLTIVDRKKDMIITGGENVYSREVEEAITTIRGVREAAVIGLPDPVWGESVAAVVVVDEDVELAPDRVAEHCRERLARFKVPKRVSFVAALPRNGTGKVVKGGLAALFEPVTSGPSPVPPAVP